MYADTTDISSTNSRTSAVSAPRVLIAAGGTGGHVFPAIAIADALKELNPDTEILFVGTRSRMEWEAVPRAGYLIKSIWISGFQRSLTPQNLLFPLKLIVSLFQSLFILRRFRPDIVISCGGFAAGPVGWMAAKLGLPLILQEQNSYPGVTNRLLAKHAFVIFTAFEAAAQHLPEGKVTLTGNPLRSSLTQMDRPRALKVFNFSSALPVLLVLGGSGGARVLNEAVEKHLEAFHNHLKLQIIWQCGQRYFEGLSQKIETASYPNLRLLEFIDDMPAAYASADLAVSRAGAATCSELMLTGTPAVLVPSPNVAGDHQTQNAQAMTDQGAAVLLEDHRAAEELFVITENLISDSRKLDEMKQAARRLAKPEASQVIAKEILKYPKQTT